MGDLHVELTEFEGAVLRELSINFNATEASDFLLQYEREEATDARISRALGSLRRKGLAKSCRVKERGGSVTLWSATDVGIKAVAALGAELAARKRVQVTATLTAPAARSRRKRKIRAGFGPVLVIAVLLVLLAFWLSGCTAVYNHDNLTTKQIQELPLTYLEDAWRKVDLRFTDSTYYTHLRNEATSRMLRPQYGWTQEEVDLVRRGEVQEGMTWQMVFWAWGKPVRSEQSTGSGGQSDVWYYKRLRKGYIDTCVYMHDGIVTSWRTTNYQ